MAMSPGKSKVMANTIGHGKAGIHMNGVHLKKVNRFKYLGVKLYEDGSCATNIFISDHSNGQVGQDLPKQQPKIYNQVQMYKSLIVPILLYSCESLLTEPKVFETKCLRNLIQIFYKKHKTNDFVGARLPSSWDARKHFSQQ